MDREEVNRRGGRGDKKYRHRPSQCEEGRRMSVTIHYTASACMGWTEPPFAAVGVNVCHLSLNRTSTSLLALHCIGGGIERRTQRASSIHIRLELGNSRLRLRNLGELDDTTSLGASTIKQNLGQLNLACGLEKFDQIFVGSRPGQLQAIQYLTLGLVWKTRTLRTIIC